MSTKYTCNNGYSSFYVVANSPDEMRMILMRKLGGPLINGKAMFTVSKDGKKQGILIWDIDHTGKVFWFTSRPTNTKNFWGKVVSHPKTYYEVNPDGSLGGRMQ